MATHATIGVKEANGTVTFIYRHSDGYPGNTGKLLHAHFTTPKEAHCLIRKGQADADITLTKLDNRDNPAKADPDSLERIRRMFPRPHQALSEDEYRDLDAARHAHFAYLMRDGAWTIALPAQKAETKAPTMGEFRPLIELLETAE